MKTFGLAVPAGKGSVFEKNVRNLLSSHHDLAHIVLPLLDAWKGLRAGAAVTRPSWLLMPAKARLATS